MRWWLDKADMKASPLYLYNGVGLFLGCAADRVSHHDSSRAVICAILRTPCKIFERPLDLFVPLLPRSWILARIVAFPPYFYVIYIQREQITLLSTYTKFLCELNNTINIDTQQQIRHLF